MCCVKTSGLYIIGQTDCDWTRWLTADIMASLAQLLSNSCRQCLTSFRLASPTACRGQMRSKVYKSYATPVSESNTAASKNLTADLIIYTQNSSWRAMRPVLGALGKNDVKNLTLCLTFVCVISHLLIFTTCNIFSHSMVVLRLERSKSGSIRLDRRLSVTQ